jgi:tetratricopeptide (TPR) repeat protein
VLAAAYIGRRLREPGMRAFILAAICAAAFAKAAFAIDEDSPLRERYEACVAKSIHTLDQRIDACNDALNSHWYQRCELSRLYLGRFTLRNEKNQTPEALVDLDAAMKVWPKIENDVVNRAGAYLKDGKFELALAALNHAAQSLPDSYRVLMDRAAAHLALGQIDKAAKDVDAVLMLSPDSAPELRARIAQEHGDVEAALKNYDYTQLIAPHVASIYDGTCIGKPW